MNCHSWHEYDLCCFDFGLSAVGGSRSKFDRHPWCNGATVQFWVVAQQQASSNCQSALQTACSGLCYAARGYKPHSFRRSTTTITTVEVATM